MQGFKEFSTDTVKDETLSEGVTFKGMEKKCLSLQNNIEKFDQALLDFQDIEDDRPESKKYTKAVHKTIDAFKKDLEALRTYLRKTN